MAGIPRFWRSSVAVFGHKVRSIILNILMFVTFQITVGLTYLNIDLHESHYYSLTKLSISAVYGNEGVYKLERKLRVKHFLCYFKEFILLFFRVSYEIIEFSIRYPKTGFVFRQDTETVRRSDFYFHRYTAPAVRL